MKRKGSRGVQRKQLDTKLSRYKILAKEGIPAKGWIRAIRDSLGMSSYQLAKRVGVHQSVLARIESGEARKATTLATLIRVGEVLDCDLVYALVPRTSLESCLEKQAQKVAKRMVSRTSHSMNLEDQGTDTKSKNRLQKETQEELIRKMPKILWDPE